MPRPIAVTDFQSGLCDDRNSCHSRDRYPADNNSDEPHDSSHGQPQLLQAQTLPLVPSSPSFRSQSKQIKTADPANFSKIATQSQASSVSPRSGIPTVRHRGRGVKFLVGNQLRLVGMIVPFVREGTGCGQCRENCGTKNLRPTSTNGMFPCEEGTRRAESFLRASDT